MGYYCEAKKNKKNRGYAIAKVFSGYGGFLYLGYSFLGFFWSLRMPCVFLGLRMSAVGILYFLFWDYGSVDFTTE